PDLYQGTEFWDFSLVDPDNRRPVDWAARRDALEAGLPPAELLGDWRDGRVKQAVLFRALQLRAAKPELFAEGAYQPLAVEGPRAANVLAFARIHRGQAALAVVTRLSAGILGESGVPRVSPDVWRGTELVLPRVDAARECCEAFTGTVLAGPSGRLPLGEVLAGLPVALLEVR
ncbi:MAG: malto-oligosyltrehalose synthase, partial [Acetobacteraceae bacterium]|nr:malto-oligosyltrehalose synthase [Acetobacteraceae bacterium]